MARDSNGQFLPGESANPARQFAPGHPHRFQPGQSGNPSGKPRSRVQFEIALVDAITNQGTPQEAATLLWEAARKGEAWAVQNLLIRFWPTTQTFKIEATNSDSTYNFSRLSNEQLEHLERILEAATDPDQSSSGAGAAELS